MATWSAELPADNVVAGDPNHPEAHNQLVDALTEVRANVDAAEKTATWGSVSNRPSTFPPTIGTTATTALAGNTAIPSIPAALSASDAQAGTSTAQRTITAKVLADEIDRRVAAAIAAIPAG